MTARFGQGGQFSGGFNVGRTTTDNCVIVDSPQAAREGYCSVAPPWSSGSQIKFLVVYPLPWEIQTSLIYQNIPGVDQDTTIVVPNSVIAPELGRNLGRCGTSTGPCNENVTIQLTEPGTMYEPRVNQVDLRFARIFRMGKARVRGNFDAYNIFNAAAVVNMTRAYGSTWLDVIQIMGGRLLKVSAQVDF
jgi:hypothetical protein